MRSFLVYSFTFLLFRTATPTANSKPMPGDTARIPVRVSAVDSFATKVYGIGLRYPDIALTIAALETGNFSSKAAIMRQNNPFAMKANGRKNYDRVGPGGYVVFSSLEDALYDYAAYEAQVVAKYRLRGPADYWQHIITRYCKAPAYAQKLYDKHGWLKERGYFRRRRPKPVPA